ncbi:hypothetical protein HDV57DRAFT_21700 [Trichoderma longibrachiatum]
MCKARAFCSAGFFPLFLLLCAGGEWMRCICEAYVLWQGGILSEGIWSLLRCLHLCLFACASRELNLVYLMREVAGRHTYLPPLPHTPFPPSLFLLCIEGSIYIIIGDNSLQRQCIPRSGGTKHRHPTPVSSFFSPPSAVASSLS